MLELKKEFKKKGIQFTQVYKDGTLAIYRLDEEYDNGTHGTWYEAFYVQVRPKSTFYPEPYEKYPRDEDFGTNAWSCSDKRSLERILKENFPDYVGKYDEILRIC